MRVRIEVEQVKRGRHRGQWVGEAYGLRRLRCGRWPQRGPSRAEAISRAAGATLADLSNAVFAGRVAMPEAITFEVVTAK